MANGTSPTSAIAGFTAGTRIAGYRLEEQIGRGGMAVVFRAHDERLSRPVALKILAPVLADDDAFRQRFIHESRAAAAVDDPNIIPVYEAGEAAGALFIATRLVRGGDLRSLVAGHGPLSPARAEWILSAIASALDAAHAAGLIHRDVKPANMLLETRPGRPDHVYLTDFGVSKAALQSSDLTGTGQFIGTVDYAAPEQIQGRDVDGRTDQYALGCSAFELLCGRPPFFGRPLVAAMYAQISEAPPRPSSVRARLPAAVDSVFARVLAKAPGDRYPTCQDFTAALRVALGFPDHAAGPASPGRPPAAMPGPDEHAPAEATVDPVAARLRLRLGDGGGTRPGATDPTAAPAAPVAPAAPPARAGHGVLAAARSRRVVTAALAAIVLLAGAAAAVLLSRSPAAAAPYQLGARSFPGGLSIAQRWTLAGPGGSSLRVLVTASNATSRAVIAQLEEPIPAAVASDPNAIRPAPPARILTASRTAVWADLRLPAHGSAHVGYVMTEPRDGATEARLTGFVRAFEATAARQDLQQVTPGGVLRSVTIAPRVLTVYPGQRVRLTLQGTLSDGARAAPASLAGVLWVSANPDVADVDFRGEVFGVSAGVTRVTGSVGPVTASVVVTVLAPGSYSHSSPALPPSPSGSPSPSASASVSPSTGPGPSPSDSVPASSAAAAVPGRARR